MKKWQVFLLAVLAAAMPVLSACDMLGLGSSKDSEREAYEQQIKAIQQAQEANQKAQEEYNKALQDSLNKYLQEYQKYQQGQEQQQLQQQGIDYTTNQTQ